MKYPKIVYEFSKNGLEIIRASICEFNGHEVVDIRAHYKDDEGVWRPSRKGLTLGVVKLDELTTAVDKLREGLESDSGSEPR